MYDKIHYNKKKKKKKKRKKKEKLFIFQQCERQVKEKNNLYFQLNKKCK